MRKLFLSGWFCWLGLVIIAIQPTSAQSNGGEDLPRVNGYYFKGGNPYYNAGYRGQCTWYVWGRARETGWNVGFTGNASGYYNNVQTNGGKDLTPQVGAIMCLPNLSGYGHVAYVVQVSNPNLLDGRGVQRLHSQVGSRNHHARHWL